MRTSSVLLAALLVLAGCSGKRVSDIGTEASATPADAVRLPPGVTVPAAQLAQAAIDGLYPARSPAERPCCWIAPQALLNAPKTQDAGYLDLTVFVPDQAYFRTHEQGLTVAIAGGKSVRKCCFGPGTYTLRFPLNGTLRSRRGPVQIAIAADRAFVPREQGVNADTRRLGIIVIRVMYRS
jgi:hypothetical protein